MPSLLSLVSSIATVAGLTQALACAQKVPWGPCDFNSTQPISCGKLSVPLDYTDATSNATLELELTKVPALVKPSKGSILLNFGGPGLEARLTLGLLADELLTLTGGHHDLIAFDPRGTGNTMVISCYDKSEDRMAAFLQTPGWSNSSDTALGTQWAMAQIQAETCVEKAADRATLVGTAFVARDMMRIVDALEGDGLLRYWGLSYGTLLGATVAAMFPDRIGAMVLDGVINPFEYYWGYDVEWTTDTDKTFSTGFLGGCLEAGPNRCALARANATVSDLEETVFGLIDTLKFNPIAIGGVLVDYTIIKDAILGTLYGPALWGQLAVGLASLASGTGNVTEAVLEFVQQYAGELDLDSAAETTSAIKCGDKAVRASSTGAAGLNSVRPVVERLENQSRVGGDKLSWFVPRCAQWQLDAKERYDGDFNVQTKNPVLVIGNTFDPVAPLVSARNLSETLSGSVLLQHDGFGHSSLGQPSACTTKALQSFFINGTMPQPGTICKVDVPLFPDETGEDSLATTGRRRRSASGSDEDGENTAALLRAASAVGAKLLTPRHFV